MNEHRVCVANKRNIGNQKPLYKTRFMLDELGNLQSEGHGINSFATMLSIGLGFLPCAYVMCAYYNRS